MTYNIYIDGSYFTKIERETKLEADLEAGLMANDRGIDVNRIIAEQEKV
jgi:hypothetical protein